MKALSIVLLSLLLPAVIFAAEGKYPALRSTLAKYRTTPLVEMSVEKVMKSDLMAKETIHTGKIYFGGGNVRWENKTPTENLIVFDGRHLWNVQYPDPDFPGPLQITKSRIDGKNRAQLILLDLLVNAAFLESFDVTLTYDRGDKNIAIYLAEAKGKSLNIKDLRIRLNISAKELVGVSYKDDVENETILTFTKIKFNSNGNSELFKYKAPKGSKVTEL